MAKYFCNENLRTVHSWTSSFVKQGYDNLVQAQLISGEEVVWNKCAWYAAVHDDARLHIESTNFRKLGDVLQTTKHLMVKILK